MGSKTYQGIGVSEGIRIAKAFVYRQPVVQEGTSISAEQTDTETARFQTAVKDATQAVEDLIARSATLLDQKQIGILKGQKAILLDPAYVPEIEKRIRNQLLPAEQAVKQVTEQFAALFENMPNTYMQERAADVRDAGRRLVQILSGNGSGVLSSIHEKVILVADDLSASDTIQLDRRYVLGFATEKGGKTAHTSIFAKSMGIPAVVGITGLLDHVQSGDQLILDGSSGNCLVSPEEETVTAYREKMEKEEQQRAILETFSKRKAALADGKRMVVAANIGAAQDMAFCREQGAEAVGLLRTEQIFLSHTHTPSEEEQFAAYKAVAEAFPADHAGSAIIRTLDIGGDKKVNDISIPKENNPFLGYRAIRLCLDQKELFLTQLRAILRASAFGRLKIMFPMISGYEELMAAKEKVQEAKSQLDEAGVPYDADIPVGIMVEIPSAALMADILAAEVDFFSIGTNDLVQYTLAVDRGNEKISYLYDYFHPAVISLIRHVAGAAHTHHIPVGMCGGMAGDPLAIPLLAGLGLDELSMAAGAVPQAKYVLSKVSTADCDALAASTTACKTPQAVRAKAQAFAQNHGLLMD
jgi:phosphotransferase system enzyme I (PtsI)